MGNITLSATLGGTIEFNSTLIRIIAYDTGTGTVPNLDTTISKGSASGKLLGVFSALNVVPTTAGSAMPASGYIKIRQWNSVAYSTGTLTGISANATAADRAGWLEIAAADTLLCTVNRLNLFKVRGDWYEIGTTDGNRATTYQVPSNGELVYLAGVWVETATSSGLYEFYPSAGSIPAVGDQTTYNSNRIATDEVRGRWCWVGITGLIRFGNDDTNSTGGFIPESGRKIRIPNIFFTTSTSGDPTANTSPHTTLATRFEFATTGGGVLDIDKACVNWYLNLNQPYSVALTNVAAMSTVTLTECATPIAWSHVGVGFAGTTSFVGLTMSLNFAGGTMDNCTWVRAALASSGHYITSQTDISGFTITNERNHALDGNAGSGGNRGNATTGAKTLIRVNDSTWTNTVIGGGRVLITTCTDLIFEDSIYYDNGANTTPTAIPMYIFDMASNCARVTMNGITFGGLTLVQPYSGILNIGAAGCTDIKLRNIGTAASPLSMGGARQDNVAWSRSATTATVTKTAHGLKINDIIYVVVSDVVAAITVAAKTVASIPTADTFTFTCLNAGATSGVLCYFPQMAANLFVLATGAAANNISIKRCYTPQLRTGLYTADNSSKNIRLESILPDYISIYLTPQLNGYIRGVSGTPALTAQTSVYGTHWFDGFMADISQNTASQSWSRTTTVITVTANDHRLRTGQFINVTVSSATTPVPLGQYTITVLTYNTFTFTGVNSGSASGTLTFVPLVGRIGLLMNESTSDTSNQYTIDSGTPSFTSAGGLYMPVIGDQITFITPDVIIGHTSFPIAEPLMAGGTIGNYDITYSIDRNDGNGYSSFSNLYYPRAGGGGSGSSTNVTMTDTTGVAAGDYVRGTNIAPNAKVSSITNGTTIVVDTANIGTVSGVLRFFHLPSETSIDAQLGFLMKVRIKTSSTNATAITSLYWYTLSTDVSRAYQYPLDPVTITVLVKDAGTNAAIEGCMVIVYADSGGDLPANASVTIVSSGSVATVTHSAHGLNNNDSVIIKGANQQEYNGSHSITYISAGSYSYTIAGSPASPATGTITSTAQILKGLTNSSGIVSNTSFSFTSSQPISGRVRKGTSATYYKTGILSGTITSDGASLTTFLVRDA